MKLITLNGQDARKVDPDGIEWPDDSLVVVAKNGDDKIRGRSAIIQLPHIEGTWVEDSMRGSTLAFRLVSQVEKILKDAGKKYAWAFIQENQPDVMQYMIRIGYKENPLALFSKEL